MLRMPIRVCGPGLVEAHPFWALLFLNNNLHIAHHAETEATLVSAAAFSGGRCGRPRTSMGWCLMADIAK